MSLLDEMAAYTDYLERRVARLETLEEVVPVGAGGWTFITSQLLASDSASITFSNIPQTYNDLMIIWRARSSKVAAPNRELMVAQFNGDTTAGNYDTSRNFGNSRLTCFKDSGYVAIGDVISAAATGDADDFSHGIHYIPSYTDTNWKLTTMGNMGAYGYTTAFGYNGQFTGSWNQYSAVTSIKFYSVSAANLLAKTLIELYGLTR